MNAATIKARLTALGFTLADSTFQYCKVVTGPNGEIFGHLTANEAAEKFLGKTSPHSDALSITPAQPRVANHETEKVKGAVAATRGVSDGTRPSRGAR